MFESEIEIEKRPSFNVGLSKILAPTTTAYYKTLLKSCFLSISSLKQSRTMKKCKCLTGEQENQCVMPTNFQETSIS